jgi:Ca2+-binding EF-hand superfamily protein
MPVTETRETIVRQVQAFVQDKYRSDWRKAFDYADKNKNGVLTRDEVSGFLAQAGCGSKLTRWAIALQVIEAMDADGDDAISWDEFQSLTRV